MLRGGVAILSWVHTFWKQCANPARLFSPLFRRTRTPRIWACPHLRGRGLSRQQERWRGSDGGWNEYVLISTVAVDSLSIVPACISLWRAHISKYVCLCILERFLTDSRPQKYTPELWQGHLWAFQCLLSTSPNWSHALLAPNMGWRTGGRWLPYCLTSEVPLLVALYSFLHTHTHTHTPPACPPTISPFSSSMLSSPAVLIHWPSQELSYPSGKAWLQLGRQRGGGVEGRKGSNGERGKLRKRNVDEGVCSK